MDIEQTHGLIRSHFGDAAEITPIAEGSDHRTYQVGEEWIVRFPRTAEVADRLAIEAAVMPDLARHLPLQVPREYRFGSELEFTAHRRIAGTSGQDSLPQESDWPELAMQIGGFLRILHALPPPDQVVKEPGPLIDESIERLAELRHHIDPLDLPNGARSFLASPPAPPHAEPPHALCHGDIKGEHVLLDPAGSVSGVIDWTDMCVSDPTWDFAGLVLWLGPGFVELVLATYGGPHGESIRSRSIWVAQLHSLLRLARFLNGEHVGPRGAFAAATQSCVQTETSRARRHNVVILNEVKDPG